MDAGNWIMFGSLMLLVVAALQRWEHRVTKLEGKVERIVDFFDHKMERRSREDENRSRRAAAKAAHGGPE